MARGRTGFTARVAATAALAVLAFAGASSAAASWWGGPFVAQTGESVTVYVSTSYPEDEATGRQWADYFASLVHGPELATAAVYVAPPAEVAELCGNDEALGCYANRRLVTVGDSSAGQAPTAVAAHEYGHHVAQSRVNPPWRTLDWGTKRWASLVGVCARARDGALHPGDESRFYTLNPGEGFAEAYRALNEARAGATSFSWPLVDPSFYPGAGALAAVEQDVVDPWTSATVKTARASFLANGKRAWTLALATPLDGGLEVRLRMPAGSTYELTLVSADGKAVLARGLWSGSAEKTLDYTICGERAVALRVVRRGPAGRIAVHVSQP
jgi:hypothetical protein